MSKPAPPQTAEFHDHFKEQMPPYPSGEGAYPFLVGHGNEVYDPIEVAHAVKDVIESLPETTGTFNLGKKIDYPTSVVPNEMLEMFGSWRVPDRYGTGASHTIARCVNPNAPDAWMYSDVFPVCACGATVTAISASTGGPYRDLPGQSTHTDDCRSIDKWRMRYLFWERRRRMAIRMIRLGLTGPSIGYRLGSKVKKFDKYHEYRVDHQPHRDAALERIAHTGYAHLDTHKPAYVADLFNRGGKWMRSLIRDHYGDVDFRSHANTRLYGDDQ